MSAEARPAPSTFYREIARNRRRSWLLVAIVVVVLGAARRGHRLRHRLRLGRRRRALVVATAMSIGSYFAGDQLVMATSGAREMTSAEPPDELRQLLNVVKEMRIAGGLPRPRVYIIDDTAPNAFATGRDPKHASWRSRPACSRRSTARSCRASSATR